MKTAVVLLASVFFFVLVYAGDTAVERGDKRNSPMQKETTHVDNQPALATLLTSYAWFDHVDGPKFAELQRDQFRSIGHWLFLPGAFSSFHKVKNNEEIWIAQSGCVIVHILEPGGTHRTVKVGLNLEGGEQPIVTVPAGYWQAAEIPEGNPYAFGTNICAPAFLYSEFEIAKREDLLKEFPQHGDVIRHLTRE
jgi:predicted cupin superfamily sugar epimerase